MIKKIYLIILDNIKTLIYALIIALLIRSFLFQPFFIPSSSMEPNLLVGDRLFVSKYSYGYSKHSFPFSPNFSNKTFFKQVPVRGDVVVFKTPADNRTDYIKRLIGMPGDTIQFINGELYINQKKIFRKKISLDQKINCGSSLFDGNAYEETLPNGKKYVAVYRNDGSILNTDKYAVPIDHYFFLGDNRDCSKDSRFLTSVGYVNHLNLVGKAKILFFSSDVKEGRLFEVWKWNKSIRLNRFLGKIK